VRRHPNTNWSHLDSNGDAITYNECRVVKDSFDNLLYQANRPNSSNTAPHASGDWHLYNSPAPHSDSHATKPCEDDNTQICSGLDVECTDRRAQLAELEDAAHDDQSAQKSIGSADMSASGDSDNGGGAPPAWVAGPYTAARMSASTVTSGRRSRTSSPPTRRRTRRRIRSRATLHDDWSQQVSGYKGAFGGTTSTASASAWSSATNYKEGAKVSFSGSKLHGVPGHHDHRFQLGVLDGLTTAAPWVIDTFDSKQYAPRVDNPNQTLAPHANLGQVGAVRPEERHRRLGGRGRAGQDELAHHGCAAAPQTKINAAGSGVGGASPPTRSPTCRTAARRRRSTRATPTDDRSGRRQREGDPERTSSASFGIAGAAAGGLRRHRRAPSSS